MFDKNRLRLKHYNNFAWVNLFSIAPNKLLEKYKIKNIQTYVK